MINLGKHMLMTIINIGAILNYIVSLVFCIFVVIIVFKGTFKICINKTKKYKEI